MMHKLLLVLPLIFFLASCEGDSWFGEEKKIDIEGKRISVLSHEKKISKDDMAKVKIAISAPVSMKDWPQSGANTAHLVGNLKFSKDYGLIWKRKIGEGSSFNNRLIAEPIVVDGIVYALDSLGRLSAYSLEKGAVIWVEKLVNDTYDASIIGAGIAYDSGIIYVTTGLGEVIAVDAQTRDVIWTRSFAAPIRTSPTVSNGMVYIATADNYFFALRASDGEQIWYYSSVPENTTVLGGAAPTVVGDKVLVVFASGEIIAFNATKGNIIWGEALAASKKTGGLSSLMDIVARPVVKDGHVYVLGYSSSVISIDIETGKKIWSRNIAGDSNPLIVDKYLFFITSDNDLVALELATGKTIWSRELPKFEDEKDNKGRINWQGPIMLDSRLLIVGSYGEMVFLDPKTGNLESRNKIAKSIQIPPVYADGSLILLNSDANLMVYR